MSSSVSHIGRSATTALRALRTTSHTTPLRHTARRPFTTSITTCAAAAESAPPSTEEVPAVAQSVLLRNNAKSATQTPGIQWTDGEQGIERQCRKMNMYTVRDARQRRFIPVHSLGGARFYATAAASSSSSSPAASSASPEEVAAELGPRLPLFTRQRSQRKFPMRKTFHFEQYMRFLNDSKVVLIFQHNNVDVTEMAQIRREIAAIPMDADSGEDVSPPRLTIVRSGLLRKVMRCSNSAPLRKSSGVIYGPIALITLDHISPPYIARLFKVMDRALGAGRLQPAPANGTPHPTATKNVNTRLTPLLAVVEREAGAKAVVNVAGLRDVATLPTLDVLRSQIVGLLSAVPSQLVTTLNQASGGHLALTLDAHRRALEEAAEGGEKSSTS